MGVLNEQRERNLMAYWLFQGNPKYYRVLDGIRDFQEMPWLVTRYRKDISVGDGVLIWKAGTAAGVYAIAEVIAPAEPLQEVPDRNYWIDQTRLGYKPCAQIKFTTKLLDNPLLRSDCKQDPILQTLLVIRAPNSTNFKVTDEQWRRVHELTRGN